jgi:glycosyltransferase involved in cell wall biosynthesis
MGVNTNPLISVIITTYNRENLVVRALKSVLNQTLKDFEVLLVDDGSKDNTRQVIQEIQKEDRRVIYIYQENKGWPSALNTGLSNAQGRYIAFLDSDDEWHPEKLEKQAKALEEFKNVGLVSCYAFRVLPDGTKKLYKTPYLGLLGKTKWKIFWEKWGIISLSTVMIRKEVIERIGFFDEKIKSGADVDFYLRCIKEFDFYFIDEPLVNYYEFVESLSKAQFWEKWIPEYEYMLEKYKEDFEECKKAKSKFLRTLATCYLLKGDLKKAKKYQWEAILNHPTNFRLYPQFLLIIFPRLYKKILFLKRKNF